MKSIGEFYKEKILCRDDLVEVELPTNWGEPRIEQNLFGWELHGAKKTLSNAGRKKKQDICLSTWMRE